MRIKPLLIIYSMIILAFAACQTKKGGEETTSTETEEKEMQTETTEMEPKMAMAEMGPASGSNVMGTVTFMEEGDSVRVKVDLKNVTPGMHAIHIHENGDCSADDGTSAGGHWNPTENKHGHISHTDEFHYGDIGNLDVGEDSVATFERTVAVWTIGDGASSDIVGKGIIVHAGADDFETQPTGGAGSRIACGVIEAEEPM